MSRSDPQPRSMKTPMKGKKIAMLERTSAQCKRLVSKQDIQNLWSIGPSKTHLDGFDALRSSVGTLYGICVSCRRSKFTDAFEYIGMQL